MDSRSCTLESVEATWHPACYKRQQQPMYPAYFHWQLGNPVSVAIIQFRPNRHPFHTVERDMRLIVRIVMQWTARVSRAFREDVILHVRPDA